jgi:hypothetical protein
MIGAGFPTHITALLNVSCKIGHCSISKIAKGLWISLRDCLAADGTEEEREVIEVLHCVLEWEHVGWDLRHAAIR